MKRKILSKPLSPTDLSKRLALPTESLPFFPSSRSRPMEFPVEDESSGRVWTFASSIRKTGFKKPVLQKEWLRFVDFHDLSVGDVVTIYDHVSEDGIMLFGKFIPRSRSYAIEVEKAAVEPSGSDMVLAATVEAAGAAATDEAAGPAAIAAAVAAPNDDAGEADAM